MSDLFHEDVPDHWVDRIFRVMGMRPQHTFQILTKRARRMREYCERRAAKMAAERRNECPSLHYAFPDFLPNVWLGVSVEDQQRADERIPDLLATPAAVRFVSYEPALGPVDFRRWLRRHCETCGHSCREYHESRDGGMAICGHEVGVRVPSLDWVIVGGESGPGARPFSIRWAWTVLCDCKRAEVPVFMKQFGAKPHKASCGDPECTHPDCVPGWINLRDKKGADPSEWPEWARVREFPQEKSQ